MKVRLFNLLFVVAFLLLLTMRSSSQKWNRVMNAVRTACGTALLVLLGVSLFFDMSVTKGFDLRFHLRRFSKRL